MARRRLRLASAALLALGLSWLLVSSAGPLVEPPLAAAGPQATRRSAPVPGPVALTLTPAAPLFQPDPLPGDLQKQFLSKGFKRDAASGNYLSPGVYARISSDALVPVQIAGKYVKDERGHTVFLRRSVYERLLSADKMLFEKKHEHIRVGYGFRSNALQAELFKQLKGHGKVASPGSSFHETGMAIDVLNTKDAHKYLIKAGFVGGCDGIEEDKVHYSVGEISKASNFKTFRRCTIPGVFDHLPFTKKH